MFTQRHLAAVFVAVWLLCAALLLNGAVVRIPPAKVGALRVQAAGVVSTGTGTSTEAPTSGLRRYYKASSYYNNGAGLQAGLVDSLGIGANLTTTNDSYKPTVSGDHLVFDNNDTLFGSAIVAADMGTGNGCSIVMRAKMTTPSDGTPRIQFMLLDLPQYPYLMITLSSSKVVAGDFLNINGNISANGTGDLLGAAHTIALSWDTVNKKRRIYVDGVEYLATMDGDGRYGGDMSIVVSGTMCLGHAGFSATCPMDFYGVRFYNRPLTDTELSQSGSWSW